MSLPRDGPRLRIREHVPSDLEPMHAWRGDAGTMRFVSFRSESLADTRAALDESIREQSRPDREKWYLAVETKRGGVVVGDVGFTVTDDEASLGWFFLPEHRGRGYAREAARLLAEFAFDTLGLVRLRASCDGRNAPSEAVMRGLGMKKVGERPRRARDGTRVFYTLERDRG